MENEQKCIGCNHPSKRRERMFYCSNCDLFFDGMVCNDCNSLEVIRDESNLLNHSCEPDEKTTDPYSFEMIGGVNEELFGAYKSKRKPEYHSLEYWEDLQKEWPIIITEKKEDLEDNLCEECISPPCCTSGVIVFKKYPTL